MRALYSIGLFLALLTHLPRILRRGGRRGPFGLAERLGRYPESLTIRLREKRPLWLHAVSVGEAVVGGILLSRLRARRSGLPFLVSTVTATGREVARERIPQAEAHIYFPLDFPGPVARALTAVKPRLVLPPAGGERPKLLFGSPPPHLPLP